MKNPSIFVHQNKTRVFFERALYAVLAPVRLVARLATRDADTERRRGYDPNPVLEIILRRKRRATAEMIVYSILLTICAPITVFLWFTGQVAAAIALSAIFVVLCICVLSSGEFALYLHRFVKEYPWT